MADSSLTYDIFARFHGDDGKMSKFGKAAGLLGAAVGALAIKFGKDSVNAYVDAEKSQNQLQAAFAKFPGLADTNIDRLNSLNATLAKKTRFDDDATASGQAVLAQFKLTGTQIEQLTPLLQDYAAKTGKDLPTAAGDLGKALLGQGRALKAVGINFTDTGTASGNFAELMGGLRGQVGGFAEREGKTAAGQAAILSNQFGELQESAGAKLTPALIRLAGVLLSVIDFVQNNATTVKVAAAAAGVFAVALGALVAVSKIQLLITAAQTAGTVEYMVAQKAAAIATRTWAVVQGVLNAVLTANPIGLVIVAVAALVAGVILAYKHSETFRNVVQAAFNGVKSAGEAMWNALRVAFNFITNAFLSVASTIIHGAADMFGWVPGVGGKLRDAADKFDVFRAQVNASLNGVRDNVTVHTAVTGKPEAIAAIADLQYRINQVPRSVTVAFQVKAQQIPRYASGTSFHPGGVALVGENGPELVDLPAGASVSTAGETRQMMGTPSPLSGGGPVNVTYNVYESGDPSVTIAKIQEYERRNGNRWRS